MLGLAALGLSGVSLLFNIAGLAIPYWIYHCDYALKRRAYAGLWKVCVSTDDRAVCDDIYEVNYLRAVRALEISGMLGVLAALVCLSLKQFVTKKQQLLPIVSGGAALSAGLLMIIGTIIFATDIALKPEGIDLHGGFVLCLVAGILAIVAGVLAFFGNE